MTRNIIPIFALLLVLFSCDKNSGVDPQPVPLPEITVIDVSKQRDSVVTTNFKFFVNVSKASDKDISVSYTTPNNEGTAVWNDDYLATNGTLTIKAGETLAFIEVPVPGKKKWEADETFILKLFNPQNAVLGGTGTATGTISSSKALQTGDPSGYSTPLSYSGYTLTWHDEFDTAIDPANWGYNTGNSGWGNNELQNYTSSSNNSYISGGSLVIEAKKDGSGGYTSARLLSSGKKEFKYGRIDIRAKLPQGKGIWPALWMLGSDIGSVGWPACGEIDIMELIGHQPNKIYGTGHWGTQGSSSSKYLTGASFLDSGTFSDKFHVFSIIWEQDKIRWFVDDVQYHSLTPANTNPLPFAFNHDFFFIMNVAVGGVWPGNPDATTVFPQKMLVDYIRVFQ